MDALSKQRRLSLKYDVVTGYNIRSEVIILVLPSTYRELLDGHLSVFKPLSVPSIAVAAPSSTLCKPVGV